MNEKGVSVPHEWINNIGIKESDRDLQKGQWMKSLYIIGNGFDCYGHNMKTKYADFKQYLLNRFPQYDPDYEGLLETTILPDGGEEYDMNEVIGSLIRTIDDCSEPDWGNLEECLGDVFKKS